MGDKRVETVIDLPWDIVDACNGFALDIGGSVMKFAYIHKDDWIEKPLDRKKDTCPVRLVNFAREEMDKSFDYLRNKIFIKRQTPEEEPLIYTTGIGGSQFMAQIQKEFQVRTENLTEMDLFIQSHRYLLGHVTRENLVHPYDKDGVDTAKSDMKEFFSMIEKMKPKDKVQTAMDFNVSDDSEGTDLFLQDRKVDGTSKFADYDDIYPCFLVMCGSGGAIMIVNKDGTFKTTDIMYRNGRMFYGLGCLLTGAKSYGELMDFAAKGTDRTVHQYTTDLQEGIQGEDDSIYTAMMDSDFPAFLFGKGVRKTTKDFKPEDLARALLHTMVTDLVQVTHLQTFRHTVKHAFFCGNFVNHQLMRTLITAEWIKRDVQSKIFFQQDRDLVDIHFLKHGAHYGALGGLLNFKLKFTEQMAEMQAKAAENRKAEEEAKKQAEDAKNGS